MLYNLAFHHFISNFARRPLANWPTCFFRLLTGQCFNLATLVSSNPTWSSWTGPILQTIFDAQIIVRDSLCFCPTIAPALCRVDTYLELPGYRTVGLPLSCCQNDAPTQSNLLTNVMTTY